MLTFCQSIMLAGNIDGTATEDEQQGNNNMGSGDRDNATSAESPNTFVRPLSLSIVISDVLPAALRRWHDLVDRTSYGTIPSSEAWGWFGAGSAQHREEQVRFLLMTASPAAARISYHAHAYHGPPAPRRNTEEDLELVKRVLSALEAHTSIQWCLSAVPGLLDAQVVLNTAQSEPGPEVGAGAEESGATPRNEPVESSSTIFAAPHTEDASRIELQQILQELMQKWDHLSLNDATVAWKSKLII